MKKTYILFLIFSFVHAHAQTITTIAGTGVAGYSGDGGQATAARLNYPEGIKVDRHGNIFFADWGSHCIRKITSSGIITTIAGTPGTYGYSGDGGPATAALLDMAHDIVIDKHDNIYIAEDYNDRIRKIDTAGIITTFAGGGTTTGSGAGDGGQATNARLNAPRSIAIDTVGNIYFYEAVSNRVRKVDTNGIITAFAGISFSSGFSGDGGPATAATLRYHCSVGTDKKGNVYIADFGNSRIRKVDTAGIITTIAGTGTPGAMGDGGFATVAQIGNAWGSIFTDDLENIYITDQSLQTVRKINRFGIINTIAGTGGTGYSGNGGDAIYATFRWPIGSTMDNQGNIFISDHQNWAIRKITNTPAFIADSFKTYIDKSCTGPELRVVVNHYTPGMFVKTFFSDGSADSSAIPMSGYVYVFHTYMISGTYTIKQVLYSGGAIDSFSYSYSHSRCTSISLQLFQETNANCTKDTGEHFISRLASIAVDSNGVTIDTLSCASGVYYNARGIAGDIYTYRVISAPAGSLAFCPASGTFNDTIINGVYTRPPLLFGMACDSTSLTDLGIFSSVRTGIHIQNGDIYAYNNSCNPAPSTITLYHSPKFAYYNANPAPSLATSSFVRWDVPALSNTDSLPFHIFYYLRTSGSFLLPGDTAHSSVIITSATTDADTSNNTISFIDTARAAFDPNEIIVSPGGSISSGTELQYTIHFENTGNDTAANIYVLDTLPNTVEIGTYKIIAASHVMFVTKFSDSLGNNILKFDFPNIKLPDSSHHDVCKGMVTYTIKTKNGLPDCTPINNRAGIYFDDNEVVLTNTARNIIGCNVGILTVNTSEDVKVFPNPAADVLNIQTPLYAYESYVVTNSIGSTLLHGNLNNAKVNISSLTPGIYYLKLTGKAGVAVRKFVKR